MVKIDVNRFKERKDATKLPDTGRETRDSRPGRLPPLLPADPPGVTPTTATETPKVNALGEFDGVTPIIKTLDATEFDRALEIAMNDNDAEKARGAIKVLIDKNDIQGLRIAAGEIPDERFPLIYAKYALIP